jgi:hypothetical protein
MNSIGKVCVRNIFLLIYEKVHIHAKGFRQARNIRKMATDISGE